VGTEAGRVAEPQFWPFSGSVLADPYPAYAVQRSADPVSFVPSELMYVVTAHEQARRLLGDSRCTAARLASPEDYGSGRAEVGAPFMRTLERMAAFSDPPRHEHVRRPLLRAFAPHAVAPRRERFAALAREHVAAVEAQRDDDGAVDVAATLVEPLMNAAIAEMLRLPAAAPPAIRDAWARASISTGAAAGGVPEESPLLLARIHAYLTALLDRARSEPGDDPLGVLVRTADHEGILGDFDLTSNLVFVINSGHRALAQAFGLFVHTLARHPGEYAELRARPELARGAVEALLRHDTSVQFTSRRIAEDVDLGDRMLEGGRLAVVMLGAANRDPDAFPDADGVDLEEPSARHVSFGYGPHFCAGAAVSRMILEEALLALVERAPRLELVEPPVWTTFRLNMRGFDRLRMRW
jgi:cytochrome P450